MKDLNNDEWRRLPLMLGTEQVCHCLGISRATVYRAIAAGIMKPPTKIGGANRWPKAYIEQLMKTGSEPPGTYPPENELPVGTAANLSSRSGSDARS